MHRAHDGVEVGIVIWLGVEVEVGIGIGGREYGIHVGASWTLPFTIARFDVGKQQLFGAGLNDLHPFILRSRALHRSQCKG